MAWLRMCWWLKLNKDVAKSNNNLCKRLERLVFLPLLATLIATKHIPSSHVGNSINMMKLSNGEKWVFLSDFHSDVIFLLSNRASSLSQVGFNPRGDIMFMPCSGLTGYNLRDTMDRGLCSWYTGPAFIPYIDALPALNRNVSGEYGGRELQSVICEGASCWGVCSRDTWRGRDRGVTGVPSGRWLSYRTFF